MPWDGVILRVPQIPYTSDLYTDAEEALVALFEADAYTNTTDGDGGFELIESRAFTEGDFLNLFNNLHADELPAIFVQAVGKDEDGDTHMGTWDAPLRLLIAVVQASSDIDVLRANTNRRLCEVERVCRQRAGGHEAGGFWNSCYMTVGASSIDIGHESETAYRGVGWSTVTITKEVLNRLEAID